MQLRAADANRGSEGSGGGGGGDEVGVIRALAFVFPSASDGEAITDQNWNRRTGRN